MLAFIALGMALAFAAPAAGMPAAVPAAAAAGVEPGLMPTPQFRRFGLADGLPSSAINAVVQDRQGFLWFGGSGGLARYDGVAFVTYTHEPQVDSLSSTDITQLVCAGDGRLWIGTGDAGLDRLDPASGHFEHWRHDPKNPDSLSSDVVYAMALDKDGSLWVGTSEGLDRLSSDGRRVTHVPYLQLIDGTPVAKDKVVGALRLEPDGTLWIGTWSGALLKRWPNGRLQRMAVVSARGPEDLGKLDQIWRIEGGGSDLRIGTRFGLLHLDADGVARPLFDHAQMPSGYVFASARDRTGRLWMATLHGIAMQDLHGGVHHFHSQPLLLGGMPGEWTWRVISDREGGLWFTFYDGGVAYLAPGWERFSRYTHIPDDAGSLSGTSAGVVAPSADGKLWVGEGNRIDKLDPATGKAEHVLEDLGAPVVSMADDGHDLWFTVRGLLMRYRDGKAQTVDPHGAMIGRPEILVKGPDGAIYITVARYGLVRVDPVTQAITAVPMPPDATDVDLRPSLLDAHDGVLWYANHEGLMRWDAAQGRMAFVPGVPRGQDVDAASFGAGGFWLAFADTLVHYRWQGERAIQDRVVGAQQGWKAPVLQGLAVDASGRLWIFAQTGLWRFDPQSGKFRQFGMQDGLIDGEFNNSPVSLRAGGPLYAPTQAGVIGFDTMQARPRSVTPSLAIVNIGVRDKHGTHSLPADTRSLRLGWGVHSLQISVRALSYIDPEANRYRFRLDGLDQAWVDTGNRGEREFMDLPAGAYTLEVQAADANGQWGSLAAPLHIRVETPPWRRWWAWLVYVCLVLLLAGWLLVAWRRRLAHRQQILLAEQRRSLAEQASAAKSQFLATLSHEIRTPMTGVMGMAELLLGTSQTPRQREYTEAMQRSGGLLLKLVNDALDLARIEAGKLELEPAPFDPRALIEDVVRLERGQAQAKGLYLRLRIDDALPDMLVGDAVRIKQVLFNLTHNALKFTSRGGVTLRACWQDGMLLLEVGDTGPGIPSESQARLFQRFEQDDSPQRRSGSGLGLAICSELVALMDGRIALDSQLGSGSTFQVRLPLAQATARTKADADPAVATGRPLEVLLVEDDRIVAAVIEGLLECQGHRVHCAGHGLHALAELEQRAYDVVLLDLDLPGLDGFEVATLIRQHERPERRVRIIAITARTGGDEEARSRAAGMDGFLRKPLTGTQLAAALAGAAGAAQPQAEPDTA